METRHHYGKTVHILDHPVLLTLLSKLGHPGTGHPELPELLRSVYRILAAEAIAREFPVEAKAAVPTRMRKLTPHGVYRGPRLAQKTKVVVASIARAGIIPGDVCFELCNTLLDPSGVRLDHVTMARKTDGRGRVVGSHLGASKIGGRLEGRILLVPDPMGATGSTLIELLDFYAKDFGRPAKTIALPMIATPEFLASLARRHPKTVVYAARLDRGLSSKKALAAEPGRHWREERGLNEHQYIVPGAGGMGEILTNSWV